MLTLFLLVCILFDGSVAFLITLFLKEMYIFSISVIILETKTKKLFSVGLEDLLTIITHLWTKNLKLCLSRFLPKTILFYAPIFFPKKTIFVSMFRVQCRCETINLMFFQKIIKSSKFCDFTMWQNAPTNHSVATVYRKFVLKKKKSKIHCSP